jgi:hypothetical protein
MKDPRYRFQDRLAGALKVPDPQIQGVAEASRG